MGGEELIHLWKIRLIGLGLAHVLLAGNDVVAEVCALPSAL